MRPFEYKTKLGKSPLLFRSEKGIFGIAFKRLTEDSFQDLQINSS